MKKNYPSKITIGIALSVLGALLIFIKPQADAAIVVPSEPIIVQGFSSTDQIDSTKSPQKIIIPDISVNIDVKPSFVKNGFWEVFDDRAAWGVGSGYPGELGNTVIFAHAREGMFGNLRNIKKENFVYILTNSNWYEYKVDEILEVSPSETKIISPTNDDERLTLYTCSGYNDSKRLVVVLSPK